MLDYSPTKTQKLLGNPDKSANPTASSPACAGLAGEHCISRNQYAQNMHKTCIHVNVYMGAFFVLNELIF